MSTPENPIQGPEITQADPQVCRACGSVVLSPALEGQRNADRLSVIETAQIGHELDFPPPVAGEQMYGRSRVGAVSKGSVRSFNGGHYVALQGGIKPIFVTKNDAKRPLVDVAKPERRDSAGRTVLQMLDLAPKNDAVVVGEAAEPSPNEI